jgi:sensor histidine kinase YesM
MISLIETILKFHKQNRLTAHLLFWLLIYSLGIYTTNTNLNQPILNFSQNVVWHVMLMLSKIPIAYFTVYFIFPIFFEKKKFIKALLFFFIAFYGLFCLVNLYKVFVYPNFDMAVVTDWSAYSPVKFVSDFFINNLGAIGALILVKLLLNHSEIQQKTLSLEKEKSQLELKSLKNQLNPHFLFNTLNNIYTLSLLNSPKTSDSIARLSEILDYILYQCNSPKVPLKNEIVLLENYIGLEKLRYDDRLKVIFNKNIEKEHEIAPLILLTLVENAFKHGAEEDMGSPTINIALNVTDQVIDFRVENSYLPHHEQVKEQKGIGLENLQHQLELIYGKNHTLNFEKKANTFKVTLKIITQ